MHPDPADVARLAECLRRAERPVIVAGGGVMISQAWAALVRLAERLQIPVATTISGKGSFPEDHPLAVGVMGGQYGAESANEVVDASDLAFFIGMKSSQQVTTAWTRPKPGHPIVHLDIDPVEIGKIYPTQAGVATDARAGLEALVEALADLKVDRAGWLRRVGQIRAAWQADIAAEVARAAKPITPQYLMGQLRRHLGPGDIVVSDASFSIGWIGAYLHAQRAGQRFLFPRGLASMGFGLPAAIGARFAQPEGKVFLLVGDGSMTYALGELAVLAKYGLDIVTVVLNNGCLGYSKFSERLRWSQDYESVDFPDTDFATIARGFGCRGLPVVDPAELPDVLATAFKTGGPVVVDARVDPWQTPELAIRQRVRALRAEGRWEH